MSEAFTTYASLAAEVQIQEGTFIHMAANLYHSITAKQPTKMLLLLLKSVKKDA